MNHAESDHLNRSPNAAAVGESLLDWPRRAGAAHEVLLELRVITRRRRRRWAVAVGVIAPLGLVAGFLLIRRPMMSEPSAKPVMSIVVTSAAHKTLPDGSTIDLQEGAQVQVAFTPEVRGVKLLRGTARFQVAKNPRRPFVVTAGDVSVRAVGTAFCVGLEPKSIEVIVTEGRVTVKHVQPTVTRPTALSKELETAYVDAGEYVVVNPMFAVGEPSALTAVPLTSQEMAAKVGWLSPRLEFTGTPLEMVVMTFNQHNRRQLVIEDAELRNLQLSGILRSDNIPGLLHMLEVDLHIRATDRGDDQIILRKAP